MTRPAKCFHMWLCATAVFVAGFARISADEIEQWSIFELKLDGPRDGNPFVDVELTAVFSRAEINKPVRGFYDGEGIFRIRFMPGETGTWRYVTRSNRSELDGIRGTFDVRPPSPGNHGPVRVASTYHFAYADGTRHVPIGTTCYTWTHRPQDMQERTLQVLKDSPFNKLRMCVFPQKFGIEHHPPEVFPFERASDGGWTFDRFNPGFFRRLEHRIAQLLELGIECDLILFHPYDGGTWGFDRMDDAGDDRYVRYVVARLAAFRNIWWSLANEYDFMDGKSEEDWDRLFQVVRDTDPYGHLRSIHNGNRIYNNTQPWVTHSSIQDGVAVAEVGRAELYRRTFRKPVVYDEVQYEGDFDQRWAQLTGPELVHRFWCGTVAGAYVGHSEFFVHPKQIVWLAHGVELRGESVARIGFLREILERAPGNLEPIDRWTGSGVAGIPGSFYLVYPGRAAPAEWAFSLPENNVTDGMEFRVEIIDTWRMTTDSVDGIFVTRAKDRYEFVDRDNRKVSLPEGQGLLLRIRNTGGVAAPGTAHEPTP